MAKLRESKGNNASSKSKQNSIHNSLKNITKDKGTTSSVKPDDNERRDGPGGE